MSNYKFLIRFYLLGFIQESTSRAEKFVERFGGDDTNVKKNRQIIDKLDGIFNPLSEQVLEIMRLRFIDELNMKDIAKQCNVSVGSVSKALNGYPDISEETRQLILKTAHFLH